MPNNEDENAVLINGAVLSEDLDNVIPEEQEETYYPNDNGPNINLGY